MKVLSKVALVLTAVPVLAGPWLFGAWEPWWFWPLAACLFLASICFGVTLLDADALLRNCSERLLKRDAGPALLAYGVFLIYGTIRMLMADVYTDAERSLLLFLLPFFVACMAGFTAGAPGRRALFHLLALNALALAAYGIVNHMLTGSERVMWMPGYLQYIQDNRASGSYYCPNHYAGILQIGAAMGLGLLLDRGVRPWARALAAVLPAVAVGGMVMSQSRAGGVALLAVFGFAALFGLGQYRPRVRWLLRGGLAFGAVVLAAVVAWRAGDYMARFRQLTWEQMRPSSRIQMVEGAIRAWQTAPVFGIGPGMHQNLWPHFAASPDGDREKGVWPSLPNHGWHSYEVHSDWVQLLEEYGAVGLVLFAVAAFLVLRLVWRGLRREGEAWKAAGWAPPAKLRFHGAQLAALLASLALALHELADFNLQMPATGWFLGALIGLASAEALQSENDQ